MDYRGWLCVVGVLLAVAVFLVAVWPDGPNDLGV